MSSKLYLSKKVCDDYASALIEWRKFTKKTGKKQKPAPSKEK